MPNKIQLLALTRKELSLQAASLAEASTSGNMVAAARCREIMELL